MYCGGPPVLSIPGTHDLCAHEPDPVVFAPVHGSCHVNAVPDGAVSVPPWLCSLLLLPPGSPLPSAIRLELQHPGDALFYMHERARPDSQTGRFGVAHVRDPTVPGLTPDKDLSCFARGYREVFSAFASSACSALFLQPLGYARLPNSRAAVLSMSAI